MANIFFFALVLFILLIIICYDLIFGYFKIKFLCFDKTKEIQPDRQVQKENLKKKMPANEDLAKG